MKRRGFIKSATTALAGFTILPGAARVWKALMKDSSEITIFYSLDVPERFVINDQGIYVKMPVTEILYRQPNPSWK